MIDLKNPSVLDARTFDLGCPGGKAAFILYYRQSSARDGGSGVWQMERTSDGTVMEQGPLDTLLGLLGTVRYPFYRRATWAEDMLRFKPGILSL